MTLCIAAACELDEEAAVVLCFDWKGQQGQASSETVFKLGQIAVGWPVLIAGDLTAADELIDCYERYFRSEAMTDETIRHAMRIPPQMRKKGLAEDFTQKMLGIPYESHFLPKGKAELPDSFHNGMCDAISNLTLRCSLLIAGLLDEPIGGTSEKRAWVFTVHEDAHVSSEEHFGAIGEGAELANAVLHHRIQESSDSLMTTLHNVYQAKKFAEMAGIGEDTGLYVLKANGSTYEVTEACTKTLHARWLEGFNLSKSRSVFKPEYLKEEPEEL